MAVKAGRINIGKASRKFASGGIEEFDYGEGCSE
jgi:hypothetical protein